VAGVCAQRGHQRLQQAAHLRRPFGRWVQLEVDLGPDAVAQRREQLFLAAEVPVQGHRRHSEVLSQPADRERLESVSIGQR
jgi:hypothetical protein